MATADHSDVPFVQAAGYTRGRPDGPPLWIVVHDMEAGENGLRAESTAAYFANPGDGRSVSSHYCVDDNSVVQCVRLADSAWTVGNRPGNNRGINWELAGYARQIRAEWLDDFGRAMLAQAARIMRRDMAEYGIPARRCSITDLQAFRPGITSHNDLRLAFGGTTHTDPGPNFPWDVLLALLTEVDMPLTADDIKAIWAYRVNALTDQTSAGHALWFSRQNAYAANQRLVAMAPQLDAILAAAEDDGNVDVVLDAASLQILRDMQAAIVALPAATADAVNDDAAARLAG